MAVPLLSCLGESILMGSMENYEETRNWLESGVLAADRQIRLNCTFDSLLAGHARFTDLFCEKTFTGTFRLDTKFKTGAYVITLTFSKDIYQSRMPKLLYTVAQVRHLQAALEYALLTDSACKE